MVEKSGSAKESANKLVNTDIKTDLLHQTFTSQKESGN